MYPNNTNPNTRHVTIYTDGACIGNPGPGGYGIVMLYKQHRRELSQGFRLTTNNRMELLAAIVALQQLNKQCRVQLYTDSRYLVDGITKGWAAQWRANQWRRKSKPVPNADLWGQVLTLCTHHSVAFVWVRGHSGHVENERCDWLSNQAARGDDLAIDEGYEPIAEEKPLL